MSTWTRPYYGITHYGESKDFRRATVNTLGSSESARTLGKGPHVLKRWERKQTSTGIERTITSETFTNLAEAKAEGEAWSKSNQ